MASKAQVLSGAQKRYLRTLAHGLSPVVQIGKSGLSQGVLTEMSEALHAHELIKVKLGKEATVELKEAASVAEQSLGATVAQTIGRILVLYRRHPDKPKISIPKKGDKARSKSPSGGTERAVTRRPKTETSSWLTESGNDDDDVDDEDFDDEE